MAETLAQEAVLMIQPGIWTLGGRLRLSIHCRQPRREENVILCTWEDNQGSWWVLSDSSGPPNEDLSQIVSRTIEPIYLAGGEGGAHAVWDLGAAFLKIMNPNSPHVTREHVTLNYVQQKQPSFTVPNVLYHGEWDGRYYLITSRVPGETLLKTWTGMSEDTKTKCVARITEICAEQAAWHGDRIQGVDGGCLGDHYLYKDDSQDFDNETVLQNSKELGMDTSSLHFYHCDMGPPNLLYDSDSGRLSIIDWETAGFVPKQWIRTKFRLSGGMDLECEGESRHEYRIHVQTSLGERGFEDVARRWVEWRKG